MAEEARSDGYPPYVTTEYCSQCGYTFSVLPGQAHVCSMTNTGAVGGRGMTDERLCVVCGHPEFAQDGSPIHIDESEPGGDESDDFCRECVRDGIPSVHPFEAAPSTDEGEARLSGLWFQYRMELDGNLPRIRQEIEAVIRAPLEERIRELERELELARMGTATLAGTLSRVTAEGVSARAEVERLREALNRICEVISELE